MAVHVGVVSQQVPMQLGTAININGNPMMPYQHGTMNMNGVSYGEPQMTHGIGSEDVMNNSMQSIAYIQVCFGMRRNR